MTVLATHGLDLTGIMFNYLKKSSSLVEEHAVACSNGSSAIDMAIHASKLKAGRSVNTKFYNHILCSVFYLKRYKTYFSRL